MANIIDAFVVTLGLDGKQFKKGVDAANKSQKEFNDTVKKTTNQLLTIAAVFTAGIGIKNFVEDTINGAANLGYLSANLRQSTQQLTAWQRASERAGGSPAGIIAQLKESQDTLAQLKSGLGPNEGLQNFFRWGGNAEDLKDGNTYLLARSRIIAGMFKTDPAQAALIARQMGIAEDQFNFLKQGPDAVMALVKAQEKNAAITERDAAAALKLRNSVLDLRDSLQATATRIVLQLAPVLERLFARLERGSQWVADHKDDIADWLSSAVKWVTEFAKAADSAAQAVGGWQNVLLILAGLKVLSMAAGFVVLAGSLVSVGTALAGVAASSGALAVLGKLGAVGAAGAAGYGIGTLGYNALPSSVQDAIGEGIARTLASFGNVGAGEAIRDNTGRDDYSVGPRPPGVAAAPRSIMQKLRAMGWSAEQAAGIAGSFQQESGLNPAAVNPKSGAYGIGQWLAPRRADFRAWAGKPIEGSSLDEQLAFFNFETSARGKETSAGDRLRAAMTAEQAARIHSQAYERPGADEARIDLRQRYAAQFAAESRQANAAAAGRVPGAAAASVPVNNRTSTSTSETRIDTINIHTNATDAKGIANELRPAVEKYTYATQANTGMQ